MALQGSFSRGFMVYKIFDGVYRYLIPTVWVRDGLKPQSLACLATASISAGSSSRPEVKKVTQRVG